MDNKSNKEILEFYKDLYHREHERTHFYDKIIQYPTTIIIIFIGGVIYSYDKYFINGYPDNMALLDWLFVVFLSLFLIITGFTVYYLYSVFHGFSRRYSYLPTSNLLHDYEKELFKYNYKLSEELSKEEKFAEATETTCYGFSEVLKNYYIELAAFNQKINDMRADKYYLTRTYLFIDLVLFVAIAIIGFLK